MKFFVTQDADKSAGISGFLDFIRREDFAAHFRCERYNELDTELAVILMCRQPSHNFKQRIRHSKKDNTLYMDLMLPLQEMESMNPTDRAVFTARKMLEEIPAILSRYTKLGFDTLRFAGDLRDWFELHGIVVDDFGDYNTGL